MCIHINYVYIYMYVLQTYRSYIPRSIFFLTWSPYVTFIKQGKRCYFILNKETFHIQYRRHFMLILHGKFNFIQICSVEEKINCTLWSLFTPIYISVTKITHLNWNNVNWHIFQHFFNRIAIFSTKDTCGNESIHYSLVHPKDLFIQCWFVDVKTTEISDFSRPHKQKVFHACFFWPVTEKKSWKKLWEQSHQLFDDTLKIMKNFKIWWLQLKKLQKLLENIAKHLLILIF